MNLGSFAGGVAQGITTQQKLQQQQQQLNDQKSYRDRQLKMQESDEAYQNELRQKQRDSEAEVAAAYTKHYGPQQVDDGQGNVTTTPGFAPGEGDGHQARDLAYMTDALAVKMKHTADPTQLVPVFNYIKEAKATQVGQDMFDAMSGNQDKLNALVTQAGGDPANAKVLPDKMQIDLGNGKPPMDIKNYLLAAGADKFYQHLREQQDDTLKQQQVGAQVKASDASANYHDAEAGIVPLKGNLMRAQANRQNALAAKTASAGSDLKAENAVANQVKQYVQPGADGKPDPVQRDFLHGQAISFMSDGTAKDPAKAALMARDAWNQKSRKADAYIASIDIANADKKALKAKFGATSASAIKAKIMANYAAQVARTPATGGSDDSADPTDYAQ